jgi:hypothetical protein
MCIRYTVYGCICICCVRMGLGMGMGICMCICGCVYVNVYVCVYVNVPLYRCACPFIVRAPLRGRSAHLLICSPPSSPCLLREDEPKAIEEGSVPLLGFGARQ